MNIKKIVDDSRDIVLIANTNDSEPSKALLRAVEKLRDVYRRSIEESPEVGPVLAKNDVRYKLGMIHAFNFVLSLPEQARDFVKQFEKEI